MRLFTFLCRPRQMRYSAGQIVTFGKSKITAKIVESRWNSRLKNWEYHLEGFAGWVQQHLIQPK